MRNGASSWTRAAALSALATLSFALSAPALESPQPEASPASLARGEIAPPFEAEGVDGTHRRVEYPKGSTTVLLFFLSSCPTCHKMIPEWNKAYERRGKLNVIGVMLDREAPGFFVATPIAFPVLRAPGGADFRAKFKIERVPTTLRIGSEGKVEDSAVGYLDPIRIGQLFHP